GVAGYHATPRSRIKSLGDVRIEPEDLRHYGLIPEFVGRLPVLSVMSELTEADLVRILTEPKNAMIRQYAKLMGMESVDLRFSPEALQELARLAVRRGTGARGLRAMLEHVMLDLMFEAPEHQDPRVVDVNLETVQSRCAEMRPEASRSTLSLAS
ncbi:MAG: hypothetical protein U1E27_07705, partial [Kiritimatiellia bacterium]|nr:hypothetical protein [Kiritimatiellia bacterium]